MRTNIVTLSLVLTCIASPVLCLADVSTELPADQAAQLMASCVAIAKKDQNTFFAKTAQAVRSVGGTSFESTPKFQKKYGACLVSAAQELDQKISALEIENTKLLTDAIENKPATSVFVQTTRELQSLCRHTDARTSVIQLAADSFLIDSANSDRNFKVSDGFGAGGSHWTLEELIQSEFDDLRAAQTSCNPK